MGTVGIGTLLKIGTDTVAEVIDIEGPGMTKDAVEDTHLTSTNRWRTYLSGMRDGGEVTFDVNFLPVDTTQEAVEDSFLGNTASAFSLTWTDSGATVWSFNALVTGLSPRASIDEPLRASISLKITGAVTTV